MTETRIPNPSYRSRVLSLVPCLVALGLRGTLVALPGFGRDEATYVYWSQRFDTWYAPLLQGALAAATAVSGIHPLFLRMLPFSLGIAALVLFDRWLLTQHVSRPRRRFAVTALALSPWQTYVGALIHPDGLLLVSMLLFAIAAERDHLLRAASAALLALLAKPSGALVAAIALIWLATRRRSHRRRAGVAAGILLLPSALLASHWNLDMLEAMRSFSQQPSSLGVPARVGLAALGLFFLAGPALGLATLRSLRPASSGCVGVRLGQAYVWCFVAAALFLGQVKANWLLPGVVLAWPRIDLGRVREGLLLTTSGVLSLAMVVALRSPTTLQRVEDAIGHRAPSYSSFAGRREAEVASARQWWHRTAEYQSVEGWTARLLEEHPEIARTASIVSDDYGLAACLSLEIQKIGPNRPPRLVLPLDPLFAADLGPAPFPRLILAVRHDVDELISSDAPSFGWDHPVTGDRIRLAWQESLPRVDP